jgi:hypothetical protein
MNKIDIKKYKYAIIAVLILLTIIFAVSNVFYKKTSPNVVDNSKLTGYFSNNMYYNEECTTDTDFDIREEFDLEVASEETIQKIRDKIEWLKAKARGENSFRKGEVFTVIAVSFDENKVDFYDQYLGIGGGIVNFNKMNRFLSKNSNSTYFNIHTHDFNSMKDVGFMCEDEGEDKCNPDNPPSITDFNLSKQISEVDIMDNYVIEQDGDIWKYSVETGSKIEDLLNGYLEPNEAKNTLQKIENLEKNRKDAKTYCEANRATKEYVDYMRSIGAVMEKISSGQ